MTLTNPPFSIRATLHEAGHAMYEAGLPRGFAFRPGGEARGMIPVRERGSRCRLEMLAGPQPGIPRLSGSR